MLRSTSGDKPELSNADVPSNPVIEVPTADLEKKAAKSKTKGKKKSAKYPPKKSNSTNEETEGEPKADDQPKEKKPHQSSTSSRPSRGVAQVRQLLGANVRPGGNGRSKQRPKNNEELVQLHAFVSKTHTGTLSPESVKALDIPTAPVPRLSFGLDRVLFNPGVYQLRDPRSRVYNFDPYLSQIMPVTEFDFNTLKDYITSSKDTALRDVAVENKKKYLGSSSSMTSVLSHFHYLLSSWRPIDTRTISQGFPDKLRSFTRLLRAPAAMFLHYQDGVYAIDADKEFDSANILMNLGKSMEKLLTMPKEEFERYRRSSENKISVEEEAAIPESYHYSTVGNFVMRSQLDAYDPRLPGTGMFDLKTRAVVSIRMDARNFQNGLGYEIKGRFGEYESYEREYFDMIRAAFLKYSLQVRVGRMDGIFVAHHNVERIFGFQYISLPEMDQALHGQSNTALGDAEFQLSLQMWQEILDKATERFPKQSLRFHFETRDALVPFMYIFAEPVTQEEIKEIQTKNAADIEAYQESLLNPTPKEPITPMEPGENPTPNTAEEPESVVYDSATPPDPTFKGEKEQTAGKELFAMALTTKNWVNNKVVERPMNFTETDEWKLEYELRELSPKQTSRIYKQVQNRRKTSLLVSGEDTQGVVNNIYMRKLRQISRDGRKYRTAENELDEQAGTIVYTEEN
ncbi:mitochondrial translation protein [Penicillium odoratum]|uniref:mitochondrial translation protein n=1 Tax=Penicillium odoratum TaxID=1167516 RepID=UPI002547EBA9|nr:mitochondrial translation protein [Penicillium odoratum]KAJ5752285.1 mitochondrial translation protein [Penicillium odoratum]